MTVYSSSLAVKVRLGFLGVAPFGNAHVPLLESPNPQFVNRLDLMLPGIRAPPLLTCLGG